MLITSYNSLLKLNNLRKCFQVKMNPNNCTKIFFKLRIHSKVKFDKTPWNTNFFNAYCLLSYIHVTWLIGSSVFCVSYIFIIRLGKNSMQTSNNQDLIGQISALSTLCITFLQHAFTSLLNTEILIILIRFFIVQ